MVRALAVILSLSACGASPDERPVPSLRAPSDASRPAAAMANDAAAPLRDAARWSQPELRLATPMGTLTLAVTRTTGAVDSAAMQLQLQQSRDRLRTCYAVRARHTPGYRGMLTITASFRAGQLTDIGIDQSTLGDGTVESCSLIAIRTQLLASAPSAGSGSARITLTFAPGPK